MKTPHRRKVVRGFFLLKKNPSDGYDCNSFSMENKSTSNIGNNATVYGLYVADLTNFPLFSLIDFKNPFLKLK